MYGLSQNRHVYWPTLYSILMIMTYIDTSARDVNKDNKPIYKEKLVV